MFSNMFNQSRIHTIPLLLIVTVILIFVIVFIKKSPNIKDTLTSIPLESSTATHVRTYQYATLENLWISYRDKIQKDGRTIDRSRNYMSTSEGQSYALLRAVWMDDKETFDRVLKWTNNNYHPTQILPASIYHLKLLRLVPNSDPDSNVS